MAVEACCCLSSSFSTIAPFQLFLTSLSQRAWFKTERLLITQAMNFRRRGAVM